MASKTFTGITRTLIDEYVVLFYIFVGVRIAPDPLGEWNEYGPTGCLMVESGVSNDSRSEYHLRAGTYGQ